MPRPRQIPAYKLHMLSGQACVILDGRHVYLGTFGSPESRENYARLIGECFRPGAGDAERADACRGLCLRVPGR
ncbi:MAG: hypothetical protein ACAI43_26115 [Phycisphaerae bacterium]|nr:hypothetical protein [Tepidisphaeraceae bacterium]